MKNAIKKLARITGLAIASVTVTNTVSEKQQGLQIIADLKQQLKKGEVKFS